MELSALNEQWPHLPRVSDSVRIVPPTQRVYGRRVVNAAFMLLYSASERGVFIWGVEPL